MKKLMFFFLLILFSSCKKEVQKAVETIDEFSFLTEFDRVRNTKTNGGVLRIQNRLANFAANPATDIATSVKLNATADFLDKVESVQINDYELKLEGHRTVKKFSGSNRDFYGKEITLSFTAPGAEERNGNTYGPYYIPEIMEADIPEENSMKVLKEGGTITWNADPLNELGVFIVIDYNTFENSDLREQHPNRQVEFEIVPDDGSYVFRRSDFPLIPAGALVIVRIIRGAYDFIDLEDFSGDYEDDLLLLVNTESGGYARFE